MSDRVPVILDRAAFIAAMRENLSAMPNQHCIPENDPVAVRERTGSCIEILDCPADRIAAGRKFQQVLFTARALGDQREKINAPHAPGGQA